MAEFQANVRTYQIPFRTLWLRRKDVIDLRISGRTPEVDNWTTADLVAHTNAESLEQLEQLSAGTEDVFGGFPKELKTLVVVLECRLIMQNTGLKKLDSVGSNIILHFDKKLLDQNTSLAERIGETFLRKVSSCRISPQYSVTHTAPQEIDPFYLLNFCKNISQKITEH